jgi:hypothetical protein
MTPRKAHEWWETKVGNCKVTSQALGPTAKSLKTSSHLMTCVTKIILFTLKHDCLHWIVFLPDVSELVNLSLQVPQQCGH